METYIIRMLQSPDDSHRAITGHIEAIDTGEITTFGSMTDLVDALCVVCDSNGHREYINGPGLKILTGA
jgi:hypothetical protein